MVKFLGVLSVEIQFVEIGVAIGVPVHNFVTEHHLYHYENMSMQYTTIFHDSKNEKK